MVRPLVSKVFKCRGESNLRNTLKPRERLLPTILETRAPVCVVCLFPSRWQRTLELEQGWGRWGRQEARAETAAGKSENTQGTRTRWNKEQKKGKPGWEGKNHMVCYGAPGSGSRVSPGRPWGCQASPSGWSWGVVWGFGRKLTWPTREGTTGNYRVWDN